MACNVYALAVWVAIHGPLIVPLSIKIQKSSSCTTAWPYSSAIPKADACTNVENIYNAPIPPMHCYMPLFKFRSLPQTWKLFHYLFRSMNGPLYRNGAQEPYYSIKTRESRFPGAGEPTAAKFNRIVLKTESVLSYSPPDAIPWQLFQQVRPYRFWANSFPTLPVRRRKLILINEYTRLQKPSFMISRNSAIQNLCRLLGKPPKQILSSKIERP